MTKLFAAWIALHIVSSPAHAMDLVGWVRRWMRSCTAQAVPPERQFLNNNLIDRLSRNIELYREQLNDDPVRDKIESALDIRWGALPTLTDREARSYLDAWDETVQERKLQEVISNYEVEVRTLRADEVSSWARENPQVLQKLRSNLLSDNETERVLAKRFIEFLFRADLVQIEVADSGKLARSLTGPSTYAKDRIRAMNENTRSARENAQPESDPIRVPTSIVEQRQQLIQLIIENDVDQFQLHIARVRNQRGDKFKIEDYNLPSGKSLLDFARDTNRLEIIRVLERYGTP